MQKRIDALEARIEELETDLTTAQEAALGNARALFTVRATLAEHGIADPTAPVEG